MDNLPMWAIILLLSPVAILAFALILETIEMIEKL